MLEQKRVRETAAQVVGEYNFSKVETYVKLTNWTWGGQVPSVNRMRVVVNDLVIDALEAYCEKEEPVYKFKHGFCCYIFKDMVKLSFEPYRKQINY